MNALTVRRRFAGVVFLLVPALLIWLSVAVYDKEFSDDATVTVRTGSVGNAMHLYADVKLRGVVVGQVRGITADGDGARVTLAIQRDKLKGIPADVTVQMLPTTLFGERFVALVPPARTTSGPKLLAGSTIAQDRSSNAIELEQVLDNVLPLLTAVQPEKLSATLSAVSQALQGRGTKLGDSFVTLDAYLAKLNPNLPTLNRDIQELVKVSRVYGDAAPDILQALTDFTTTSGTIAEQRANLSTLYGSTTSTSQDLTAFLRQNQDTIIRLSADSRGTLQLLGEYAPSFPCTLRTLANFVPAMDKALGKGTSEPGLHVTVRTVPSRGKYLPGKDKPSFTASTGPNCYPVPYLGRPTRTDDTVAPGLTGPLATAPPTATTGLTVTGAGSGNGGLGLPNSPQENELVNELLAPAMNASPQSLPDWSSLLAGPVFRGAEVSLK
ncbi:MCE family protein [Streptomyces sp. So13.3]|uniref:MCE family protein n=1 Tax=Streptomyces TaxID=1883 RepID=UPI00110744A6|nr:MULTISPECIES: MCE family protein [Streptomyces]QNA74398.1 MCE family protein [Streptomyces sp. So13.3]